MKLTKFNHACFALTKNNETALVDPGNWSTDITNLPAITAVIITHEHQDHFDHSQLSRIAKKFPQATVYAHSDITQQITELPARAVAAGDYIHHGEFTFSFYGGDHAIIHPSLPPVANLGVLINQSVYYPGDSFALPDTPVKTLALPVAAPWMKISEAMDFCTNINASELVFPTHDAILSPQGKTLADTMLGKISAVYQRVNESIEISD